MNRSGKIKKGTRAADKSNVELTFTTESRAILESRTNIQDTVKKLQASQVKYLKEIQKIGVAADLEISTSIVFNLKIIEE